MTAMTDRIIEEALMMPAEIRLNLVEKLITSLNVPMDEEVDRLWAEEAEHRISQIETGEVQLVPGEEVFFRIRAKHTK